MTQLMYAKNNLYESYDGFRFSEVFSSNIPDVTQRTTLENLNYAINLCETWGTSLDVGGGDGRFLRALSTRFKQNILVEISEKPEHKTILAQHKNISIHHQLIEDYQGKTKIDFILLADVYEHIPAIEPFAQKISSLQDIGGVVYIMTPNPIVCGPADESGLHHTRHPYGHIKHYPTNEICDLMKRNGYELIFLRFEEGPYRQRAKGIIFALSRRDKAWKNNILYSLIRPFVLLLSRMLCAFLDSRTHRAEKKDADHRFSGITQDLAFKKVRTYCNHLPSDTVHTV